ncbi:MAG: FadR/GntR family transcriptional regulator [Pseudomonadota bacterium]
MRERATAHDRNESDAPCAGPVRTAYDGGVSDSAALAQLRAYIAEGGFGPGDRLPPERALGAELGLRRSELRRALELMEREGTLWRHVGKGTFLSAQSDQSGGNELAALAKRTPPADVMRARGALEPAIARLAASHASAADVQSMRETAARSRRTTSWREYEALDNELHRQIAEAAGSLALLALFDQLNTLRRMVAWGRQSRNGAAPAADHPSFGQHDRLIEAIAGCDGEAAFAAMRDHLRSVEERFVL